MLRQYHPQRSRTELIGGFPRSVGTIPIGSIFHIGRERGLGRAGKCIVRAWHPRVVPTELARGLWVDRPCARFGHLATVEHLASGRQFQLADHHIRRALGADDE
ncbi:hypothetical protein [Fulvimarina endophytica]|nr:hypothetical protein [Fulvimarina endophytica]